jgi:hypothetical protein
VPRFLTDDHEDSHVQISQERLANANSNENFLNPSAWGHLNPSSYCDVGRLFYGVFKLWSKLKKKK